MFFLIGIKDVHNYNTSGQSLTADVLVPEFLIRRAKMMLSQLCAVTGNISERKS